VIETPQQHEKSNKRIFSESSQILSESEEEKSKKQKLEEISKDDSQALESVPETTSSEPTFTMEFLPSTVIGKSNIQGEEESSEAKQENINSQYWEMKNKNIKIKQDLFPKLYQGTSKTRLLSALDFEKGRLNIAVLEPTTQTSKGVINYKVAKFSYDLNQIHLVDKMELHRKTGEMVCRDVIQASLGMKKLHNMSNKIKEQLRLEKLLTRTKQMRIEELENMMLKLRDDSKDIEPMQDLINTKNTEILTLKQQLNLTNVDHVQTPELKAVQQEKDQLVNQIIQMKAQIELYEQQIEALGKELLLHRIQHLLIHLKISKSFV
jgi:hypothetical protein